MNDMERDWQLQIMQCLIARGITQGDLSDLAWARDALIKMTEEVGEAARSLARGELPDKIEVADMIIVAIRMADAIKCYDILAVAYQKAQADIERGVR